MIATLRGTLKSHIGHSIVDALGAHSFILSLSKEEIRIVVAMI
jgi:hypothetical protein